MQRATKLTCITSGNKEEVPSKLYHILQRTPNNLTKLTNLWKHYKSKGHET